MKNMKLTKTLIIILSIMLLAVSIKSINDKNRYEKIINNMKNETVSENMDVMVAYADSIFKEDVQPKPLVIKTSKIEKIESTEVVIEPTKEETTTQSNEELSEKVVLEPEEIPQMKLNENDTYLLARIVMAESEGESFDCKKYIAQTVINRVNHEEFPDSIEEVIFQKNQFTPIFNGRWDRVEPNQECYDAVKEVLKSPAPIIDALYFECCPNDSWHSRNLNLLLEEDGTRFYNYY